MNQRRPLLIINYIIRDESRQSLLSTISLQLLSSVLVIALQAPRGRSNEPSKFQTYRSMAITSILRHNGKTLAIFKFFQPDNNFILSTKKEWVNVLQISTSVFSIWPTVILSIIRQVFEPTAFTRGYYVSLQRYVAPRDGKWGSKKYVGDTAHSFNPSSPPVRNGFALQCDEQEFWTVEICTLQACLHNKQWSVMNARQMFQIRP